MSKNVTYNDQYPYRIIYKYSCECKQAYAAQRTIFVDRHDMSNKKMFFAFFSPANLKKQLRADVPRP